MSTKPLRVKPNITFSKTILQFMNEKIIYEYNAKL